MIDEKFTGKFLCDCAYCGKPIEISMDKGAVERSNEYVLVASFAYHTDCYLDPCIEDDVVLKHGRAM